MAAFLEDYSAFLGNGTNNEDGLSLSDYLEKYDPSRYRSPSVSADIMVIRYNRVLRSVDSGLSILLVKRRNHPCIGNWALPGGFCNIDEDLEAAAKRELYEETGLTDIAIEQVNTWGEVWRDPRDRIITTSFIALVENNNVNEPVAGDDAAKAGWFDIKLDTLFSGKVKENDKEINRTMYQISLHNSTLQGMDNINAKVVFSENSNEILKEERYKILENNNIAFDHARFIINGLRHIKKSIDRR